jgi:hypothetical protein
MEHDNLINPSLTPPPQDEIKILSFDAEPYPDGRRVLVKLVLSPFLQGPNGEISITNQDDELLATINIVNLFIPENEFTLHIPENKSLPGSYTVNVEVFYIEEEEIEQDGDTQFNMKKTLVDSTSTLFTIP